MAKVINITMPEDLFDAVERQARLEDRPRSSLFREAIRIYLALKRREMTRKSASKTATRETKAEKMLRDNVIALNRIAMSRGITEEDLLGIGQQVREELFRERYGSKR